MPIERKDRSFDLIFDQVSMDTIPADYITEVTLTLADGSSMKLDRDDLLLLEGGKNNALAALDRDDLLDVAVKLDFESIKSDVVSGVGDFLKKYFKE